MAMLEYQPRSWWKDGIPNAEYIQRNLSRHLLRAGLHLELGAVVLEFRWIAAQACTGGILGVKKDFELLDMALGKSGNASDGLRSSIRSIHKALEWYSPSIGKGLRLFHSYFYRICSRQVKMKNSSSGFLSCSGFKPPNHSWSPLYVPTELLKKS